MSAIAACALSKSSRVNKIAFVEDDEIGAGNLILENLLDRIVVGQRTISRALLCQSVEIVRHAAVREGRPVDHNDDAVDGNAAFDCGPMERLHERLWQRESRSFDDDVFDALARQDGVECRDEFIGDGTTEATVGEFDDVLLGAGGIAATFENVAVDADIAELVDDDGKSAALRVRHHVTNERGLAGAKKAGDDGAGNAGEGAAHRSAS